MIVLKKVLVPNVSDQCVGFALVKIVLYSGSVVPKNLIRLQYKKMQTSLCRYLYSLSFCTESLRITTVIKKLTGINNDAKIR